MTRPAALLAVLAIALGACGGDGAGPRERVLVETGAGVAELEVEIADSAEERRRGLMGRESLPENAGMLFLFPDLHHGGFWMKDTLIPLSIAFLDSDGRVLAILDMEPCEADPCPLYDPGVGYHSAIEVNRGAFDRLGVEPGDRIVLGSVGEPAV